MTDLLCSYHPIYRSCVRCGLDMDRYQERVCAPKSPSVVPSPPDRTERIQALREARELIKKHAISTWKGGLIDRSDGITEVLVDFDRAFPEALGR